MAAGNIVLEFADREFAIGDDHSHNVADRDEPHQLAVLRNTLSEHGSVSRGVCECDAAGLLRAVVELTKIEKRGRGAHAEDRVLSGDELVSMNFWGFTPALFPQLREQFTAFLRRGGRSEERR